MSDPSLDKDEKITYKKTVAIFTRGARAWRAVGIYIYWMTQYPTVKEGMPSQIGANLQDRISMPLSMETHSAVVFGDEGVADGWKAHQLPRSPKGRALVKVGPGATSNPVQVVYLDKEQIPTLPLSGIWYPSGVKYATPITNEPEVLDASATQYGPADGETRVAVNETETTLVTPDGETVVVETPAEELSPEDKVLVALLDSPSGVLTFAELMTATGISKSTLHRLLTDKMVPEKRVVKGGHNEWKLA
jgi:predicted DNA-binding transcriptional regulator AlpA